MVPAQPTAENRQHALDYWQIIRNRFGLIFLCFLLIFGSATIITHVMPRKYRAVVELELKRQLQDFVTPGLASPDMNAAGENFLKTQLEIIAKRKTLDRVVDKVKLMERWQLPANQRQFAIAKLQGNLDPTSNSRSEMITITYYDESAQLAANIANAIAESYRETRLEVDRELAENSVRQLTMQVAAKEQVVEQANKKMATIRAELGIIELPGERRATGSDVVDTVETNTLGQMESDIYKMKSKLSALTTEIELLKTLDGDALIRQAGELRVENDTIKRLGPQYQELILQRENYTGQGLGRKHPAMIALERQIESAREQLLSAANDYRNNLSFQINAEQTKLKQAEGSYQEKREEYLENSIKNQDFLHAKTEWETLNRELIKLRETLSQQKYYQAMPKTPFTIHKSADEPEPFPTKPNVKVNLALGAVVGLLFGFGLAFFLEYLDTTVKSIDEVERLLGVSVLAVIPKNVGLLHRSAGLNPDAEAYRILRTNIEFNRKSADANIISVVSGSSGEGKSTTMVNLATVCAQGGYNTLIIDGDLRRPRMHTFFDTTNEIGLSTYLSTPCNLEDVVTRTAVDNLYLLPSGQMPSDSSGLLNSARFRELIDDVKSRFDIVLIDSPPILGVSDGSVLCAEADMTLLVVQHRKLPRHMLQRVKTSVDAVGGEVIGVVLNNVDINSDTTYGYYTTYYTYYTSDTRSKKGSNKRHAGLASKNDSKTNTTQQKNPSYQDVF